MIIIGVCVLMPYKQTNYYYFEIRAFRVKSIRFNTIDTEHLIIEEKCLSQWRLSNGNVIRITVEILISSVLWLQVSTL